MEKHLQASSIILIIILAIIGGFFALLFDFNPEWAKRTPVGSTSITPQPPIGQAVFSPPAPDEAPAEIKDSVMMGFHIMQNSRQYAQNYVGNQLNCSNCHFDGGRMKKTISLVGAPAVFPSINGEPSGGLSSWINACFTGSLNGKALPPDSPEMKGLLAYIQWISRGIPIGADVAWVGLKPLRASADAKVGEKTFLDKCTPCHGKQGLGTAIAPPVWGAESWSSASPIAKPGMLTAFIHKFMPFGKSYLTPDEAGNTAAFLLSQQRPKGGGQEGGK